LPGDLGRASLIALQVALPRRAASCPPTTPPQGERPDWLGFVDNQVGLRRVGLFPPQKGERPDWLGFVDNQVGLRRVGLFLPQKAVVGHPEQG
jgi:hypothetical protein